MYNVVHSTHSQSVCKCYLITSNRSLKMVCSYTTCEKCKRSGFSRGATHWSIKWLYQIVLFISSYYQRSVKHASDVINSAGPPLRGNIPVYTNTIMSVERWRVRVGSCQNILNGCHCLRGFNHCIKRLSKVCDTDNSIYSA